MIRLENTAFKCNGLYKLKKNKSVYDNYHFVLACRPNIKGVMSKLNIPACCAHVF